MAINRAGALFTATFLSEIDPIVIGLLDVPGGRRDQSSRLLGAAKSCSW